MRVGINGFGRMGRLAMRAGWSHPDLEFVAINEPHGTAESSALLLEFDSIQGRWDHTCAAEGSETLKVDDQAIALSFHHLPAEIPWGTLGVDAVLECSGQFRRADQLTAHLDGGARKVLVSAPVKGGPPNVVMGVNNRDIDFNKESIASAASCTTNCLAPIARVLHDSIGIRHGLVTTIHDPTNTQRVVDGHHKDPRRGRSAQLNLIPTSTNSATATTQIIPELAGKLDSVAVRAPVQNASLTDCVFAMERNTSVEEINGILEEASRTKPLLGILGFEKRPLVSSDYVGNSHSATIDALSTRVTDHRLVKVLAWYDNEWGYAHRMIALLARFAEALRVD